MIRNATTVAALLLLSAIATAQTVHYPDDVHATAPNNIGFPFYTPGGGAAGLTVRTQFVCPDSFLSAQGLTEGYVTHIGFSLGGEATYSQFQLRAGVAGTSFLVPDWATNLPDQRVQLDLSGQLVKGGGTAAAPVNDWVEFELAFPFHYAPGDDVIVDLIMDIAVIDEYLTTTPAVGVVERAYNFSYFPGSPATQFNDAGLKFRMTFAPLGLLPLGDGCQASNGQTPSLTTAGAPQLGQPLVLNVADALPNELGLFVFGFSRDQNGGVPLPADLGGGCSLHVSTDVLEPVLIDGNGDTATLLLFPNDPSLHGAVLFTQFAQLDVASPAVVPFTFSNAGLLSVY